MKDWYCFEASPWELALDKLRSGDTLSAVRLLTLLEGEQEDVLEEAFEALDERHIALDIAGLPEDYGSAEIEKRLRLEKQIAGELRPETLPEGDPLRLYLEEMAAIPACGDVEQLAQRKDPTDQVMLMNLSLSRVVELSSEFTGWGVLLLDLIQEGSLGLWQGILAYSGEDSFASYRDWWIRQFMAKAVTLHSRSAGLGRKMRQALEDYRAADRTLLTRLGRNATVEEIAQSLGVSPEDAQVYEEMLRTAQLLEQAKAPRKEPEEEDQAVEDTAYFQSRQRIAELLSILTEQEASLLTLRFGLEGGLPATTEETAAKLGITPEQVVTLEAAALSKLRDGNG